MKYFGKQGKISKKTMYKIQKEIDNITKIRKTTIKLYINCFYDKNKKNIINTNKYENSENYFSMIIGFDGDDYRTIMDKYFFIPLNIADDDIEEVKNPTKCFVSGCKKQPTWEVEGDQYIDGASLFSSCNEHKINLEEHLKELKGETYRITRIDKPLKVVFGNKEITNVISISYTEHKNIG